MSFGPGTELSVGSGDLVEPKPVLLAQPICVPYDMNAVGARLNPPLGFK